MRVRRFWSIAHGSALDTRGYRAHASVYRGSDRNQRAADELASRAIADARSAITSGREQELWYAYERSSRPEPIVQEFVDESGVRYAAVTMNRWGASILNTASLVMIDVDIERIAGTGGFFGKRFLSRLFERQHELRIAKRLMLLGAWIAEDSSRAARVYRTKAGLRYVLPTTPMDPSSDEVASLMERLNADALYARLCRAQESFRARLSPKPWRIGMRVPPVVRATGTTPETSKRIDAWMIEYDTRCREYAVCELLDSRGPSAANERVRSMIDLHDAATGASSGRPLA